MTHHRISPLLLLLAITSLVSGCNPQSATAPANGSPDILKLLYWQAPTILNPHLSTGFKDSEASRITLEPLASFDHNGKLVPILAAEIPSKENGGLAADGKSVTWKLKPGVKWSDGQRFTAQDVAFTYEFVIDPQVASVNAGVYEAIASVKALDDTTVKITFKDANPSWTLPFVGSEGMILPKHQFTAYKGANSRSAPANLMAVGTGPYRVVEFKPGDVVVYEANPNYRQANQLGFKRVELKGGGDATSAARAVLQTGEADFAENLQVEPQVLTQLEAGGKGKVVASFGPLSERILFNQTDPNQANAKGDRSVLEFPHPFFSDIKVRQAFNLAIDRENIATQLYGKTGKAATNFLISPNLYNSPNTRSQFNLEQAAKLLEEAGWKDTNNNNIRDKNGVEMKVIFQSSVNPARQKTQELIAQSLTKLGVEVELKSIDASIMFSGEPGNTDTVARFYADLQMFTTGNVSPDPQIYMKIYTCKERATPENNWSGTNYARYCNPQYDKLWEQAAKELDPQKRTQLFIQMNDLLVNDVAVMPIVHRADVVATSNQLMGVDITPWDRKTWNIAQWKKINSTDSSVQDTTPTGN
jgi:peptide/nickel transport system substrate-binding protein